MILNYKIGASTSPITLEVQIGTTGVTFTSIFLKKKSDTKAKEIVSSNADSGNVNQITLGTGTELQEADIFIRIVQNFGHIASDAERDAAIKTTVIDYKLTGGAVEATLKPTSDSIVVTPNKVIANYTSIIKLS